MTSSAPSRRITTRRALIAALAVAIGILAIAAASRIGTLFPSGAVAATSSPGPATATPAPVTSPTAPATDPPATAAPPTPEPTDTLVAAPLTGLLVTPEAARQHPIAVMIDDHFDARPQSGFNSASIVWHAPAEGGVPRYMLIFQDKIPAGIGPVRSAREYYIEWAAEWNAMYVHAGGSPQAIATLLRKGDGDWVYNADQFRWGGRYLWRTKDRFPPHNVYTDGAHLRQLAKRLGAKDGLIKPVWTFAPDKPEELRPVGGRITVVYPYETIVYRYDRASNTYVRYTCAYACDSWELKTPQKDRADGKTVAPKNVVILRMVFGALNDGHPSKHRLEARNVGEGPAWISTNGITIKGTWRKETRTGPTLLFDAAGNPVTLTAGQTFVQVIPTTYTYKIKDGTVPKQASPNP